MDYIKKIPIILSLLISILTIIISWAGNFSAIETIIRLIYQIPMFYAIGMVLLNYIDKNIIQVHGSEMGIELEEGLGSTDDEEQYQTGQDENEFQPIDFAKADV